MEVVASLSQNRTAAAQCGLFTHKSVPVIFEPPCNLNEIHTTKIALCGAKSVMVTPSLSELQINKQMIQRIRLSPRFVSTFDYEERTAFSHLQVARQPASL